MDTQALSSIWIEDIQSVFSASWVVHIQSVFGCLGCGYPKCFQLSGLWISKVFFRLAGLWIPIVFSVIWVVDTHSVFGYLGCGYPKCFSSIWVVDTQNVLDRVVLLPSGSLSDTWKVMLRISCGGQLKIPTAWILTRIQVSHYLLQGPLGEQSSHLTFQTGK